MHEPSDPYSAEAIAATTEPPPRTVCTCPACGDDTEAFYIPKPFTLDVIEDDDIEPID
jgi:hypothetical protein